MKNLVRMPWPAVWGLAAAAALAGCAPPPLFTNAPAAGETLALPASAAGVWSKEGKDDGSRVRLSPTGRGSFQVEVFNTRPAADEPAPPPLSGRSMHFAGRDWLVLDLAAWEYGRQSRGEMNGYLLLHYQFEHARRVCLQVPVASAFADAVERRELQGKVKPEGNLRAVLVTSPAAQWIGWWNANPAVVVLSEEKLCLQRVEDPPATFQREGKK